MSRLAIAALLLACAAVCLHAQDPTVDEVLQKLADDSADLNSLVTKYRQAETDEFGDETEFCGTFYYLRPGRYRWALEVNGKVVEEMVSNESLGWRLRHNVKAIDKVKLATIKRRTGGITLTGGAEELREAYDMSFAGIDELTTGPAYHLICVPKDGDSEVDSIIQQMEIWINVENSAPVVKVVIHQRDGILNSLEFTELLRNAEVNESIFVYRVPRGYEEIVH